MLLPLKLAKLEYPSIGMMEVFGQRVWAGWVMIAALIYSMIPPVILCRMKLPLAEDLHQKALYTDAETNKADWQTAGSAILGILGVGVGWRWADGVATLSSSH